MIAPSEWILKSRPPVWLKMLLCATVFVLAAGWGRLEAASAWNVLETPRFKVVSQLSETATRAWAEEFNDFITALNRVIPVNEHLLPQLTVVIFAKEKEFRDFLPMKRDGKSKKVAGFFARYETWGVIGMRNLGEDEATSQTIYHEGVHWLLSVSPKTIPLCINEGLAEVFSTFKTTKGMARWGAPVAGCVAHLNSFRGQQLSVKELLHTNASSDTYNEDDRAGSFYAKSWLLVHYLLFGKREGSRTALNDFVDACSTDISMDEAFQKGFGMEYAKMDARLENYINGGKYIVGEMKLDARTKLAGAFSPASQVEVEMALAKLASGSGRQDAALKHAEAAIRLSPNQPECWETLAGLQTITNEDGGYEAAKKAVALGSKNGWCHLIVAQGRMHAVLTTGDMSPAQAREIANQLEEGIKGNPYYKSAYRFLARTMCDLEQYTDDDVLLLKQGMTIFPNDLILRVGLGYVALGLGDGETAWTLLSQALERRDKLDPGDLSIARSLKKRWILKDVKGRLARMAETGKPREALAVIDGYIEDRDTSESFREELQAVREPVALLAKFAMAKDAIKEGRRDEARAFLEEITQSRQSSYRLRLDACDQLMVLDKLEANEWKQKREAAERERTSGTR